MLRERLEQRIDDVLDPLFDALTADKGLANMVGGGKMEVVDPPDHGTRIQAVRELLDRAYGRPKQVTKHSGPDGGPVQIIQPPDASLRSTQAAELLAHARVLNGNANANGSGNGSNGRHG